MTKVAEKPAKKKAVKNKKPAVPRGKNKILTDMIDADMVKMHVAIKKRNPSYPKLPKFLLDVKHKLKLYKDKGLQESVLRGFYKRVENWNRTNELVLTSTEGE